MSENSGDHRGIFNGGDDFQGAAAIRTVFNVDIEYPFTKTLPGFRPLGRHSPFKTVLRLEDPFLVKNPRFAFLGKPARRSASRPSGFVSKRAQHMRGEVE